MNISSVDGFAAQAPWAASPFRRSRHPACVEEQRLMSSAMYRRLTAEIPEGLFGMKVGIETIIK